MILHAGTVRAHHFAHLPGAVCSAPQTEPETEEHRAGKLLLARWLRACLPAAQIIVEAHIQETNQRADLLLVLPPSSPASRKAAETDASHAAYSQDKSEDRFVASGRLLDTGERRIAIEFQCANMQAREWRRRHKLYHDTGIQDLWILGGSRLNHEIAAPNTPAAPSEANPLLASALPRTFPPSALTQRGNVILRTTDLERGLLWDGAPLLFLDAIGEKMPLETLARFRSDAQAQAMRPSGKLSAKSLLELPFPFALLAWPDALYPEMEKEGRGKREGINASPHRTANDWQLWEWLAQRHRVTPQTLPGFFGLPIKQTEAFACEAQAWQAAIYYRFIHRRVGDRWWLTEVETWTRAYLPLAHSVHLRRLQSALAEYQEILAAAGFLSLPRGYNRVHASVMDDLTTLSTPPDPQEVLRLARYRRTLAREARADYQAQK